MTGSNASAPVYADIAAAEVEQPALSPFTPNFTLLTSANTGVWIGGSGRVFGTRDMDLVYVRDMPGTITLDASFNRGGDEIVLRGNASQWTILRDGSTARLSDEDTNVIIPFGQAGAALIFADGIRFLNYDTNGDPKIGSQTIDAAPAPVSSEPFDGYYLGIDAEMSDTSILLTSPGNPVFISANAPLRIYGTDGKEHIILTSGTVQLDGSFNRGGDTVTFDLSADNITVELYGSLARFHSERGPPLEVSIPIGVVGIELEFEEGSAILKYDVASNNYTIDQQIITAEPAALSIFG